MADDDRAARIRRAWRYFAVVQMTGGFWTALIALWNHDVYGALSMACVAAFGFLTWRSTQLEAHTMSDYRQSESCDGELMFLDRQFDRYAADHAGQLPERYALTAESYDRLVDEVCGPPTDQSGHGSVRKIYSHRGVLIIRANTTRPATVPPTHPPAPAAPTEVVVTDGMLLDARAALLSWNRHRLSVEETMRVIHRIMNEAPR